MPETAVMISIVTRAEAKAAGADRYFTGVPCVNGHVAPRRAISSRCLLCERQTSRDYQQHRYWASPDEFRRYRRRLQAADPIGEMLRRTRKRAQMHGIECGISRADLQMPTACPCCGVTLEVRLEPLGSGHAHPACPTIDRFDSSLGYTPGNVNIICWRCNNVKRSSTAEELATVLRWMNTVRVPAPYLKLTA